MNIVEPYAKMMEVRDREEGIRLLRKVELCARVSHASEEAQTENSWERFLTAVVLNHGDWSVTEHASVTVDARVDRGVSHEWVRHRMGAYTQSSTRFINYAKKVPAAYLEPRMDARSREIWEDAISYADTAYQELVQKGIAPQIARSVLPNALGTKLVVTYNLRSWRHFFLMRTTKETHPQMRETASQLLEEFKGKIPLLYDDIEAGAKQAENLKKAR